LIVSKAFGVAEGPQTNSFSQGCHDGGPFSCAASHRKVKIESHTVALKEMARK